MESSWALAALDLAGELSGSFVPELGDEAVFVEQVVDDLIQEPEVRGKAAPRSLVGGGHLRDRQRTADGSLEQPPRLSEWRRARSPSPPCTSSYWPPIIPIAARGARGHVRSRIRSASSKAWASNASPLRIESTRRTERVTSPAPGERRRRPAPGGRRGPSRRCGPARSRPRPEGAAPASRPLPRRSRGRATGRIRLPPPSRL